MFPKPLSNSFQPDRTTKLVQIFCQICIPPCEFICLKVFEEGLGEELFLKSFSPSNSRYSSVSAGFGSAKTDTFPQDIKTKTAELPVKSYRKFRRSHFMINKKRTRREADVRAWLQWMISLTPRKGTAARAKWADFPLAAPNAGVWATELIGRIPMETLILVMQLTSLSVISHSVYHNPRDLSSRNREY